jgi:hypothetical protein
MWILVSLFCVWLVLFVLACVRHWAFAWGAAMKAVAFSKRELVLTFSTMALLSFLAGFLGYYLGTGNPRPALLASAHVGVYELMGATPLRDDEWAIALRASNEDSVVLYASSPLSENLKGVRFFRVEGREGNKLRLQP